MAVLNPSGAFPLTNLILTVHSETIRGARGGRSTNKVLMFGIKTVTMYVSGLERVIDLICALCQVHSVAGWAILFNQRNMYNDCLFTPGNISVMADK